ncbi:MAG: ABC transporter ATP-binding protein/permease [Peptococcaceae bacterium]|jgi:ATP-binding cassette subfamily B protein|nr:ABC transporter ATP-binding protein/permease [Peptococcaceae bacterium]
MRKLLKYLKPFTRLVALMVLLTLGRAMGELALPALMAGMMNQGMLKGDIGYILTNGLWMLLTALGAAACSIAGSFVSSRIGAGFARDLRSAVFSRVEDYSLHEFDQIGAASLINRTTNDMVQIQTTLVMAFRFVIYAPVMCVGGILMASVRGDSTVTAILVAAISALILFMVVISRFAMPMFQIIQKKLDHLNLVLRENLTGIRVIRAFNKLRYERDRFRNANRDLTDVSIRAQQLMAAMNPLMMLFINLTILVIVWFSSGKVVQDRLQIGDMVAFIQYATQILFSFIMITMMFMMIPRVQASAERINEVLDMTPEILDPSAAAEPARPAGTGAAGTGTGPELKGRVEFDHVSFFYPGAELPALKDLSFTAEPGKTTAILGGTGAGKSTLVNLIPRFYDVSAGRILMDGTDIRQMTQDSLRKRVGFVPQTAVLFSGSVNGNIRLGKEDASEEEIRRALETAQALDFVSQLPDGFGSRLAQGGVNLSGGQRQRLSIARALVRKPDIYVFDDSFSALDFKTDALLRAALKQETQEAAVIIVAQRVSTIMNADQIIVLDQGEIVGAGVHRDLLQTCAIYHEIVASQLPEEEWLNER